MVKAKNKLKALSINEELGDIPTHYMKSGSSMRPKEQLLGLGEFKRRIIPEYYRDCPFDYDVWYNTNELSTIRSFLYTDFLGKGIYLRVNSIIINDRVLGTIVEDPTLEIDEDRIKKITDNLENKYTLELVSEYPEKIIFLPGSNQMNKGLIHWGKVKKLVNEGWKIKPHPITAHVWIADLRQKYGYTNVLNKKGDAMSLLKNCTHLAVCPNSEMGLSGLLLKKQLVSVACARKDREKNLVTYDSIYTQIGNRPSTMVALKKILSSKRSGIIFSFDEDAEERLERYLESFWSYTFRKP